MNPNQQLITRFYEAFARRDAEAMLACYHPQVAFSDAVFVDLSPAEARAMWRMLCSRAADLKVEFSAVTADDHKGSAHWDAHYTFSATGRKVLNRIDAQFEFEGGLIRRHQDSFDLKVWMPQALGLMGSLLGGTGFFQKFFRGKARKGLAEYMARHPEK
jgi:ketosteroid isomerase-like protein